jgi:hypothetical protein
MPSLGLTGNKSNSKASPIETCLERPKLADRYQIFQKPTLLVAIFKKYLMNLGSLARVLKISMQAA